MKQLVEGFLAEPENLPQIVFHKKAVDQRATRNAVIDDVANDSIGASFQKSVFMVPATIGAFQLFVDKTERRFPNTDSGFQIGRAHV